MASKSHYFHWLKSSGDIAEWVNFAYCWSCIGKGLRAAWEAGLFCWVLPISPGPPACVMVMNVPSERTRNIFHSTQTTGRSTAVYGKVRKSVLQTLRPCVVKCAVYSAQGTGYSA